MPSTRPQTVVMDGVTYRRVEGHVYTNGAVYVPTANLPENYNPTFPVDAVVEKAWMVVAVCNAERGRPMKDEEWTFALAKFVSHTQIKSVKLAAIEGGFVRLVEGTHGSTAEYTARERT